MTEKNVGTHSGSKLNLPFEKKEISHSFTGNKIIAPLQMGQGQFNTITGWLNNETILYLMNVGFGSNLYTYNVHTGITKLVYESEAPIASVMVNPFGSRILIHAAPTTYEGLITIIDINGKELMKERLEAFDFVFKWSPYNENLLLISLFAENWDFSMSKVNIAESQMTNVPLKEPFVYWLNEDDLLYLDWSNENATLLAPLMKKSLTNMNEGKMLNQVYHVESIKNFLMTITVKPEQKEEAVYSFLRNDFQELSSFTIPHLTRFSDWLIPFFDFDEENHFLTFKPLYSAAADEYQEGFQLISFDFIKGEMKVLFEDLKNEPLSCAPNGELCLYGFYYEKLLDMKTKQIIPLINIEK